MNRNIIEMFSSIQGEGQFIGTPSIFIRFAKCNLTCPHCDTKYSWQEEGKYSVNDVIDYIKHNQYYKHIVLTGGEPLLYQDDIIQIIKGFRETRYFTIETNGTLKPDAVLVDIMSWCGLWSVSPKLHLWETTPIMKRIVGWSAFNNVQFKFVITNLESDMEKVQFLVNTKTIEDSPIIIQPDGNRQDYDVACRELADYVNKYQLTNIRVLPQFHRLCWGQKRNI